MITAIDTATGRFVTAHKDLDGSPVFCPHCGHL
jgi:hypothetical protein